MNHVDMDWLANLVRDTARAEILPRFRRLNRADVKTKSDAVDLVTEADTEAEWVMKRAVNETYPDATFIGEESVHAKPALRERVADAPLAVIVDPVDGTSNFAAGLPLFGVMAAVLVRGETVGGIIYDPMGDDWVMAEKGAGTWLKRPDGETERLSVRPPVPLAQMVGNASTSKLPTDQRPRIMANLTKVRIAGNYRVAAHDYRTFASGHLHFLQFFKLHPWDHAPGALIASEAGGYVAKFDGSSYMPDDRSGGLLVASDKDSWHALRQHVFDVNL